MGVDAVFFPSPDACEFRALSGIVRSYHRVFGRELPPFSILLRRQSVLCHQVPLQRFEFLGIVKADCIQPHLFQETQSFPLHPPQG